jgi:hypothetical protein
MARKNPTWRSGAFAASAFGLGVITGLFLKEVAQRTQELARNKQVQRETKDVVVYDENLPEPLERREPAPQLGQPRYGGTGAIGISPAAVARPPVEPQRS